MPGSIIKSLYTMNIIKIVDDNLIFLVVFLL